MSHTYLVKLTADIPYPFDLEYRIEASSFALALSRGARKFKVEERIKGKRLNRIIASATKLV